MAYKNTFWKLSWGGTVAEESDTFVNSIHIGNEAMNMPNIPDYPNDGTGLLDAYINLISAWFIRPGTGISYTAKLEWIKLAHIGVDGLYVEDAFVRDLPASIRGGLAEPVAPQLSVALSMQSLIRRGPGKDGRIYPPQTGTVALNGTDSISGSRAESFQTLLNAINDLEVDPGISASVILVSPLKGGFSSYVRKVRVGNVIDTQRRRRNKIQEVYTEVPVDIIED